jgi:hypothetical protein
MLDRTLQSAVGPVKAYRPCRDHSVRHAMSCVLPHSVLRPGPRRSDCAAEGRSRFYPRVLLGLLQRHCLLPSRAHLLLSKGWQSLPDQLQFPDAADNPTQ